MTARPAGRGRFVTLEGGEGAGKSTLAASLAERLAGEGIDAVATREPGGAPGAEEIRALLVDGRPDRWDPTTEALLHTAARRDHVRRTVRPALEAGRWVICDRFVDSTIAYQGYGHGLDTELLRRLQEMAVEETFPDLTLVLDLPVATGLARAAGRGGGEARYEALDAGFHERVRYGFSAIVASEPERCRRIDADRPAAAVLEAAWAALAPLRAAPSA